MPVLHHTTHPFVNFPFVATVLFFKINEFHTAPGKIFLC
jgi:hypothetical protein